MSIDPATIETQLPLADFSHLEQPSIAPKQLQFKGDRHSLPAPSRLGKRLLAGGAILLLGLVGYGYWYLNRIPVLTRHTGEVNTIDFTPDGRQFASGSDDTTIKIWNLSDRQELRTLTGHTNWVYSQYGSD
jgi:WD40 repeat protein